VLKTKALFLGLVAVLAAGFALGGQAIPNWSAPATWTPTVSGGLHTLGATPNPVPFIAVPPCRVADTRGNGFLGAYGPPSIGANTTRTFVIAGKCGIPATASAVSFNFAAANVGGLGDLRVFPDGGSTPLVSTLNYNVNTPLIANAAIVPLGTTNGITVQADAVTIDLFFDVNGYYYDGNGYLASGGLFSIMGTTPGGSAIYGENNDTATGSRGVRGIATGGTGRIWGVLGQTTSAVNTSRGVYGNTPFAVPQPSNLTASTGVWGEGVNGVVGVTVKPGGECATYGLILNTAGTLGQFGCLGDAIFGTAGSAVVAIGDYAGTGAKYFIEPHPTDASKEIRYVALEGPESGTYFRGTGHVSHGLAVINVPEDFRMVTDDDGLTVQLTPVGASANMYIASEDLNQIVVRSSKDVTFHYMVNGVRRSFKDLQPINDSSIYMPRSPDFTMPTGLAPLQKERLIANGTYNPDGSVNLETARAVGWVKIWQDRARPQSMKQMPDPADKK
jgi:hypothetical protein